MSGVLTEFSQKGCALITGAGGRLGPLLRAARDTSGALTRDFLFQSRAVGADIQWSPGEPTDHLPKCEALIALWGVTSGSTEELALNTRLVDTSIDLAHAIGASRVIHMSSAGVYGPGEAMSESHPLAPIGPYGAAKHAMEEAVNAHRGQSNLQHLCLRLANVVGADSLEPALTGKNPSPIIDQFADGRGPLRSYTCASDLMQIFDGLLSCPAENWPNVLNIAAPYPVAMDALLRAAGRSFEWVPAPASAVQTVTLDVSHLQRLLPHLTVRDSAESLIADWTRLLSQS